ncbi:hypothetical protein KM043_014873 [Ampulex compressa]|nr:hypothetical protein KM043_014873 [Ampulex compressa]
MRACAERITHSLHPKLKAASSCLRHRPALTAPREYLPADLRLITASATTSASTGNNYELWISSSAGTRIPGRPETPGIAVVVPPGNRPRNRYDAPHMGAHAGVQVHGQP